MIDNNSNLLEFANRQRENYRNSARVADEEMSKIILYVSAGAFAASIALFGNFNKPYSYLSLIILIAAWLSLGVCIIAQVIGYYLDRRTNERLVEASNQIISNFALRVTSGTQYNDIMLRTGAEHKDTTIMKKSNRLVLYSFCYGVFFMILFAATYLIENKS